MSDIPAIKPIKDMQVLVVDTQALVHEIVQSVFKDLGINKVVCTQNAYHALRECHNVAFDIVILAFNVSSDKDGFHLYEELRMYKHITNKTTVIFLSAETSAQLVNCVMEFQPHDFWVKPLAKQRVQQRLVHMFAARKMFHKLNCMLDLDDCASAIYQAERLLENAKLREFHGKLKRIKGECLIKLFAFEEAEKYYQELIETIDTGWANVGLLQCMLVQGKSDEAEGLIETLITRDDTRFPTYDLLAQHHIKYSEYDKAYDMMQRACELAPRNMNRNKKLWDLARLNHDRYGQLKAVRAMEKYGKNSIHDSPMLSVNVLRASIDLASTLHNEEGERLANKAEKMLEGLQAKNKNAFDLKETLVIAEARIAALRDDKKRAESLLSENKIKETVVNVEDGLDKMKVFHELGMHEKCLSILKSLQKHIVDDEFTSGVVSAYLQQESIEREQVKFSTKELKQMAASHYHNERYEAAFELLTQARVLSPKDVSMSLSLLKVLSRLQAHKKLSEKELHIAEATQLMLEKFPLNQSQKEKATEYTALIFEK
jgi:DNA-binding NarL/FixJ family response regulator